ncbi:MAG: tRNA epoxyqueuosine(34) reductase QueG [Ruminococcaceae bacterium]|nr:tRNA epoxyqueuosine(34) reductase QueG [Oscillospiraceae bacterium]
MMIMANDIKEYAKSIGISDVGICDASKDERFYGFLSVRRKHFSACSFEERDAEKRTNPRLFLPTAKSVVVCAFSYYTGHTSSGNLSCYAGLPDYHKVVQKYLDALSAFIHKSVPGAACKTACDTSPLMDRMLAYRAGLGFFGKNNLLIHPTLGSYFFIGSVITDVALDADAPLSSQCMGCDACIKNCPGQALSSNFGFDCETCISYLTQIKTLTEKQKELVEKQESVYGCDVCQKVCPHNQHLPATTVEEFCIEPLEELKASELSAMSNRQFKKTYKNYPFSWCGRETILKNFLQKNEED